MRKLKQNNSGFVSVITFSITILIIIGLLTFSYGFYSNSISKTDNSISKTELLNSIISFRSQILSIQNLENATINYQSTLDLPKITIYLTSNTIIGEIITSSEIIENSIPSLVTFCSDYTFNPVVKTTFKNTGNCISKLN